MRWKWLAAVCVLTILTTGAYQPLFSSVFGMQDPALIVLGWLALTDRLSRVAVVLVAFSVLRINFGIGEVVDTVAPLLAMVVTVRVLRQLLDPYHPWKRFQILAPSFVVAVTIQWFLLTGGIVDSTGMILSGVFLSLLFAGLMLPILDLATPLLRSARYPL